MLQSLVLRILEIVNAELIEREDRRIEDDAESYEVPVRGGEGFDVRKYDLVLFAGLAEFATFLRARFHDPVEQRSYRAQSGETDAD